MTLGEIQDSFQHALLAGTDGVLTQLADGPREPKEVLLGLYRDSYILRLIEFAQNDHELLRAYLGDEAFEDMVRDYAAAYPSRYRNAKDFCTHLPQYLAEAAPYCEHPAVAELAALEKALNDAFYAKDAAIIGILQLSGFAPDDWALLRFTAHPSAIRLNLRTNAADIWSALKRGSEPPAAVQGGLQPILVWRADVPKFRALTEEEAMLWDEAAKGVRFGVLCEMAAAYDEPDGAAQRAAGYLQGWIASGLLAEAALTQLPSSGTALSIRTEP
jgi:hypothetical protein